MTPAGTTPIEVIESTFEAPELLLIGDAKHVIRGIPGNGWDCPFGMTEPEFEFEADEGHD